MTLKEWLKKYHITRKQFSLLTHTSLTTIDDWIAQKREPNIHAALLIEILTDGLVTAQELRPTKGLRFPNMLLTEQGTPVTPKAKPVKMKATTKLIRKRRDS